MSTLRLPGTNAKVCSELTRKGILHTVLQPGGGQISLDNPDSIRLELYFNDNHEPIFQLLFLLFLF